MGLEIIGMGLGLVGSVVSAMGQMQRGRAQAAQMEYQAQVARNNQIIAEQNAVQARQEAAIATQNQGMKTGAASGAARAAAAANGLDVNIGSPLDLQESIEKLGMVDALTLHYQGETKAVGYQNQGRAFEGQAGAYMAGADNARQAGAMGAFSSIIGGASSFASRWGSGQGGFSPIGIS